MKKIIIMGATSGLGFRVAELLALRGVSLGLAGRNAEVLNDFKERFPENVVTEIIDINSPDAPGHLDSLISKLGGMDIYIHLSGIGYDNPSLSIERECGIICTDTEGFARMTLSAFKYFLSQNISGHIAAVSSVAATKGIGKMAAYSASKAFDTVYLTALEQLAYIKKAEISFSDIRPGWTRTPLLKEGEHYLLEMEPENVARSIIKAIAKRKRVAYIDSRWEALCSLWKLIPDSVWTKINPPL